MIECTFCGKIFKRKGIGSHLKSCKSKLQNPALSERRLSTSLPHQPSLDVVPEVVSIQVCV